MAKKKKELTDDQLVRYRQAFSFLDMKVAACDREARDTGRDKLVREQSADFRDAWAIARDALEKVVRREQERRIGGDNEAGL